MKKLLGFLLLSALVSINAYADERIITQKTEQILVLKKLTKTKFEKISDGVEGVVIVETRNKRGLVKNNESIISEHDNQSYLSFEVTGKNILKIVDDKEQIIKEIPAQVKTTLFGGNVKEITIAGKELETLYSNSIKRAAAQFWRGAGFLGLLGLDVKSSIMSENMLCHADEDLLVCKQNMTMLTTISY